MAKRERERRIPKMIRWRAEHVDALTRMAEKRDTTVSALIREAVVDTYHLGGEA